MSPLVLDSSKKWDLQIVSLLLCFVCMKGRVVNWIRCFKVKNNQKTLWGVNLTLYPEKHSFLPWCFWKISNIECFFFTRIFQFRGKAVPHVSFLYQTSFPVHIFNNCAPRQKFQSVDVNSGISCCKPSARACEHKEIQSGREKEERLLVVYNCTWHIQIKYYCVTASTKWAAATSGCPLANYQLKTE